MIITATVFFADGGPDKANTNLLDRAVDVIGPAGSISIQQVRSPHVAHSNSGVRGLESRGWTAIYRARAMILWVFFLFWGNAPVNPGDKLIGSNKMQILKSAVLIVIAMLVAAPAVVNAESWICEYDTLVREITVASETGASAPCEVVYNKASEGLGSEVLWTATTDGAYCDEKADGLAEKLQGFGWSCTAF